MVVGPVNKRWREGGTPTSGKRGIDLWGFGGGKIAAYNKKPQIFGVKKIQEISSGNFPEMEMEKRGNLKKQEETAMVKNAGNVGGCTHIPQRESFCLMP